MCKQAALSLQQLSNPQTDFEAQSLLLPFAAIRLRPPNCLTLGNSQSLCRSYRAVIGQDLDRGQLIYQLAKGFAVVALWHGKACEHSQFVLRELDRHDS